MTKPSDPYSRVYWRIVDDDRFADIYGNDSHLASWLRLLIGADQSWPASAPLPASVKRASVRALSGCGLVELRPGSMYRIHGLDAERGRRQSQAEAAASARWSGSNADRMRQHPESNAQGMPRRDEPSKAEPSRADDAPADAFSDYYALTVRYPRGRTDEWLRELVGEFGDRDVGSALAAEWKRSSDLKTFLSRTDARLRTDARRAEQERTKPKPKATVSPEEAARLKAESEEIIQDLMRVEA